MDFTTGQPLHADEQATDDQLFSQSEVYHENSKATPTDFATFRWIDMVNSSAALQGLIARQSEAFRGYPEFLLPKSGAEVGGSLRQAIEGRRSTRVFGGGSMSMDQLGAILHLASGVVAEVHGTSGVTRKLRAAPSAGALYPLDVYCFVINVMGLPRGRYFYDPVKHGLRQVDAVDATQSLDDATYMAGAMAKAAVCIAITAVFPRIKFKYGERGYRFALLEAGHVAQNGLLVAESMDLAALPIGGFADNSINELLGLDGVEEATLYLLAVGTGPVVEN